ncbi:hypothetical protein RXV94_13100 [Yeosuana sp. MJ-SS3]|uniref:Sugar transporter n=1 Tax=Gilvirhabdus luticola TaxID=3079858 RepID=A0ABU3U9L7_9FLAO|nr:hypothetical protein [Yeosuana sp. MJ-SS3]MDU8887101.1 hypothetical protein [Yeosuana sp. MJ-SS3]
MSENSTNKPPIWFWIVSVIALVWNGMGVNAYLQQAYNTESFREMYPPEQLEIIANHPAWLTAAFAIAVFGGALGSITLLLRKKWAVTLFLISLIAVIVQMGYAFINDQVTSMVMVLMIIVFAIFLVWFSRKSAAKGWIS